MNGSHGREVLHGIDTDRQDEDTRSSARARRAGGYGGFLYDSLPLPSENDESVSLRQRETAGNLNGVYGRRSPDGSGAVYDGRRRSRERDGLSAGNIRTFSNGPGGRQIGS